jgi:hypothetical protein
MKPRVQTPVLQKQINKQKTHSPQPKTKNRPTDPMIPLLGIYPKECKSGYNKGTCTPMFTEVLFIIAKLWKQPRCPTTDEWMD